MERLQQQKARLERELEAVDKEQAAYFQALQQQMEQGRQQYAQRERDDGPQRVTPLSQHQRQRQMSLSPGAAAAPAEGPASEGRASGQQGQRRGGKQKRNSKKKECVSTPGSPMYPQVGLCVLA